MSDPTVPGASEPASPPAHTAPATPPVAYAPPTAYTAPAAVATNGMAIASFITSLVGLGVVGVILGHIAMSQIKKSGAAGKGFAIAGLIIGYLSIAIAIVVLLFWIIAFVTLGAYSTYS